MEGTGEPIEGTENLMKEIAINSKEIDHLLSRWVFKMY